MAGVVHIAWYATVFRKDSFAAEVAAAAPLALRYGATQYSVQVPAMIDTRSRRWPGLSPKPTGTATGRAWR